MGRHPIAELPFPVIILGIAQPEGEHGVGQLLALPVAGMDPDENRPVVATLDFPRVELRGVHGVGGRRCETASGSESNWRAE